MASDARTRAVSRRRITRGLTGLLFDPFGDPVTGATVRALRFRYTSGTCRRRRLSGLRREWQIRTVALAGRDITDVPIVFPTRTPTTGVQIVLTNRLTTLTGAVVDSRGQPATDYTAVIFAEDEAQPTRGVHGPGAPTGTLPRGGRAVHSRGFLDQSAVSRTARSLRRALLAWFRRRSSDRAPSSRASLSRLAGSSNIDTTRINAYTCTDADIRSNRYISMR